MGKGLRAFPVTRADDADPIHTRVQRRDGHIVPRAHPFGLAQIKGVPAADPASPLVTDLIAAPAAQWLKKRQAPALLDLEYVQVIDLPRKCLSPQRNKIPSIR